MKSATGCQDSPVNRIPALCEEAVEQGKIAHHSYGKQKREAQRRKGSACSLLILLGSVEIDSVQLTPSLVIGLTFPYCGRVHIPPQQLTPDAQEVAFRRIAALLERAA